MLLTTTVAHASKTMNRGINTHRAAAAAAADDYELMNGNGPEDLLLDELVRNIKWAAQQRVDSSNRMKQHHRFVQDEDLLPLMEDEEAAAREYDYILQQQYQQIVEQMQNNNNNNKIIKSSKNNNNKIQQESEQQQQQEEKKPHRPFAYRPSEAGYYDANSIRPQQQQSVDPITQSEGSAATAAQPIPTAEAIVQSTNTHDIRSLGQKEDIFGDENHEQELEKKQETKQLVGKFAAAVDSDDDDKLDAPVVEQAISREPVAHAIVQPANGGQGPHDSIADIYLTALVAGCTASAVAAILALGVCFYRWQRRSKAAQDVEYPAYGITGPGPSSGKSSLKSSPSTSNPPVGGWGTSPGKVAVAAATYSGDKKLAHSAHMFHFQHQKQQVIAMESSHAGCERRGSNSGAESDEDNEEGDYTVYECPGLAPTGEMEVKNPLFLDDPTPATPAAVKRQSK